MTTTAQYPIDSDFVVRESSACMPSSCWGSYVNVAVLEVDQGVTGISMISERARGVRSIVRYEGKLFDGRTNRSAAGRARRAADELCAELNAAQARRRKAAATRSAKRAAAEAIEAAPALEAIALAT